MVNIDWVEIHCVKISSVEKSSSMNESEDLDNLINTYHTSYITADGKTYKFSSKNISYPFSVGDEVVLFCRKKDEKLGIYNIQSFINNTKGITFINSVKKDLYYIRWLAVFSLLLMFIPTIGLLLGLIGLIYTLFLRFVCIPKLEKAINLFSSFNGVKSYKGIQSKIDHINSLGNKIKIVSYPY